MPKEHLTFESTTPSFLRRLRGEIPGQTIQNPPGQDSVLPDPDRHAVPQVRPKKPRNPDDDDYQPVIVDEFGRDVDAAAAESSSGEIKEAAAEEGGKGLEMGSGEIGGTGKGEREREGAGYENGLVGKEVVAVVGSKRRRDGPKVVGGLEDREEIDDGKVTKVMKSTPDEPVVKLSSGKSIAGKTKKKGKKIKLSFDDDG